MRVSIYKNSGCYAPCYKSCEIWLNEILRKDWAIADDNEGWIETDEGVRERGKVEIFGPRGAKILWGNVYVH